MKAHNAIKHNSCPKLHFTSDIIFLHHQPISAIIMSLSFTTLGRIWSYQNFPSSNGELKKKLTLVNNSTFSHYKTVFCQWVAQDVNGFQLAPTAVYSIDV